MTLPWSGSAIESVMKLLRNLLIAVGIAPLLCLLLVIPMIGILYASGAALGGMLLMAFLMLLQWPIFCLFRRYLPQPVDEQTGNR